MYSNFIKKTIDFLNDEQKELRKNYAKILNSPDIALLKEGTAISNAVIISEDSNTYTFSYSPQFVKIKEEQSIVLVNQEDRQKVGVAEVLKIDYLKHQVTLIFYKNPYNSFYNTDKFLLIQDNGIFPKAVHDSLYKMAESHEVPLLVQRVIDREPNIKTYENSSIENIIKTASNMNNSFMVIHGPPGAGKTYTSKKVIADLLKKNKRILITSNSHSAINNLVDAIEIKDFKGLKIYSRDQHKASHPSVKNSQIRGEEISSELKDYDLVAGTCFSLAKITDQSFDYLFVDEASQIKLAFILSVLKVVKNVVIMGDHLQLTSISPIAIRPEGDAVLNYILEDHQILPKKYGYFLNTTYRCEPQIAKVVSDVYYNSQLKWSQTKKKEGFTVIKTKHNLSSKMNEVEGKEVLKIYKSLRRKKVKPEDIIIIAPYNAQVSYLKNIINNDKTTIGSVDLIQGGEAKYVIISFTVAGKSAEDGAFVSNKNRVNVAISRAKDKVFMVMSEKLPESKHVCPTFKKLLKIVDQ